MSVTVSFVGATAEELERAEKDPGGAMEYVDMLEGCVYGLNECDEPSMRDRPCGGPGKAFAGLQFLLDRTDVRLDFLMDGFTVLESGTLFTWSPEQIASVAHQLRATPWEQLAAHYAPEQMTKENVYPNMWRFGPEDELEWLKGGYEDILGFFTEAAEGGYGAFMTFSF